MKRPNMKQAAEDLSAAAESSKDLVAYITSLERGLRDAVRTLDRAKEWVHPHTPEGISSDVGSAHKCLRDRAAQLRALVASDF